MHDGGGPDRERSLGWWRTRNIITKVDKLRLFVRKVEGTLVNTEKEERYGRYLAKATSLPLEKFLFITPVENANRC